jgi:hypothetical protein
MNSLTGGTERTGQGRRRRIDIPTELGIRRTRSSGREEEGCVQNNQGCALDREEKGVEEKRRDKQDIIVSKTNTHDLI